MKRILMTMGMVLASCAAMAYTQVVDGITWTYTVSDGKASVGSGIYSGARAISTSTIGAITVPATLGGHPVTSIGGYAFHTCSGLTNVTISSSVTSIGEWAFGCCSGLTSVAIPSSVANVGESAFEYCSGLTYVTIPEGVTQIEAAAFYGCSGLTSVTIPSSVTNIGKLVFYICSGLRQFDVDANNPNYKSVNSMLLTKEGKTLIAGVNGDVVIPDEVTNIGLGAFRGFSGLTSVMIPLNVTSIGDYAFYECSGLTNVVFGGNAPTCGSRAFDGVKSGCTATVYKGTTGWDDDGDGKWQGLTLVWRDAPKPDGGPYTETVGKTGWTFMVSGGEAGVTKANPATGAVTIPSALGGRSVTSIEYSAFEGCTELTSVTIPASVTTIGESAFWGCTHLADVYFEGDTISSIGVEAFRDCYWDLIMHVPATWQGRGRTICGYTVLKGSMFIVK